MLTSDLDSEEDKDRAILDSLLSVLLEELDITSAVAPTALTSPAATSSPTEESLTAPGREDFSCRTSRHEVQLIVMRLLSVFMSRTKAGTKPSSEVIMLAEIWVHLFSNHNFP